MVTVQKKVRYLVRENQENKDESRLANMFSECFGPTTQREVRQWIRRNKADSAGLFKSFVAEVDGEVISTVSVVSKKLHLGEGVYVQSGGISGVCTCSDFRRKGIVSNLLQLCIEHVENSGVSNFSLYTGTLLPAHRIYMRKGFRNVETWCAYVKFLDFDRYFRRWIRRLNRYVKFSKIAQKTLENWDRSVVFELEDETQCFRFRHGRFQVLSRLPRSIDITIATTVETLAEVMWGAIVMKMAVQKGKMRVKKGTKEDLKTLRKILTGIWDE